MRSRADAATTDPVPAPRRPRYQWVEKTVQGTLLPGPLAAYNGMFLPLTGPTLFGGSDCSDEELGAEGSTTRCRATNESVWMLDLFGRRVVVGRMQATVVDESGVPATPDLVRVLVSGNVHEEREGASSLLFDTIPSGEVVVVVFVDSVPVGASRAINSGIDPSQTLQVSHPVYRRPAFPLLAPPPARPLPPASLRRSPSRTPPKSSCS